MIKTRSAERFVNLTCTGKVKNVHIIFVGKHEVMKQFGSARCRYHTGRLFPVYAMKAYEWRQSSIYSWPQHYMVANGRPYASAAFFFSGKTTLVVLSGPQRWSGRLGKNREIFCPCRKSNHDSSDDQSVTQALYRLC